MTLVVARADSSCVAMLADIQLTFASNFRESLEPAFLHRTLKSMPLNRTLAVAFAIHTEQALAALRQLPDRTLDGVTRGLLEYQMAGRDGPDDAEYLLLSTEPVLVRKISRGKVGDGPVGWIGSPRGFAAYQAYRTGIALPSPLPQTHFGLQLLAPEGSTSSDDFATLRGMHFAFDGVIANDSMPEIGGHKVVIVTGPDGLRYAPTALRVDSLASRRWPPGWSPMVFASGADGGYAVELMVPREPGVGGFGLHYPHARLGVFYPPFAERGTPVPNVAWSEFIDEVAGRFGISLIGGSLQ